MMDQENTEENVLMEEMYILMVPTIDAEISFLWHFGFSIQE